MIKESIVVIGAGPAGLAAAAQLELYRTNPLVFESSVPGGLLLNASSVQNYPGVKPGIPGRELVDTFPVPSRLTNEKVTGITRDSRGLYTIQHNGGSCISEAVIIASGTSPKRIALPGVPDHRIFYHLTDIPEADYESAAVVGGGDAALDYAVSLSSRMAVTVYARGDFSRAVPHLLEQVNRIPGITLRENTVFPVQFTESVIVAACGRKPEVGFLSPNLLCSPPDDGSFHMCGDCTRGRFRQTAIAVGDGVRAAMAAAAFLRSSGSVEE